LLLVHGERPRPAESDFRQIVRRERQEEARGQFLRELRLRTRWDAR
jgi:hypothetical protein